MKERTQKERTQKERTQKERTQKEKYPLDSSGIIHLAVLKRGHSNSFRISVTLKEKVRPLLLQQAFQKVTPRFPTIVAGIQNGLYHHYVIPVEKTPKICPDRQPLIYMTAKEIQSCAMRVLYRDRRIAVEVFHSLTDGYGGLQFLKALLAEYLKLAHGVDCFEEAELLTPDAPKICAETEDSYCVYAGNRKAEPNHVQSYQISHKTGDDFRVHVTTAAFPLKEVLQTAHNYHVTLTTFLTAVMAASIMEMQARQNKNTGIKPVQVMVPVNLRKLFPSRSLRNFSLYALPCIQPGEEKCPIEVLLKKMKSQLDEQLSRESLQAVMSMNVYMEQSWFFRKLPLKIKCAVLRLVYPFFGAKNSSITFSNLGEISFPEPLQAYIQRAELLLTPRLMASYNCGAISYNGQLNISFSRTCQEPELERIFLMKIFELGHTPTIEVDGVNIDFRYFLTGRKRNFN